MPKYNLGNILFLDIETVSGVRNYAELPDKIKALWDIKAKQIYRNKEMPTIEETYTDNAGFYAEFGRIVCISVGLLLWSETDNLYHIRLKSFSSKDEKQLLEDFKQLLLDNPRFSRMCGHNIKEFDIPVICRRMLLNYIQLPPILDINDKKPWETGMLDTMLLWRFGAFKNYASLNLLTTLFDVPTPKDDIDGSEVGRVFWEEDDLDRISIYCEKDVVAVAQLLLKFERLPLVQPEHIFSAYQKSN